MHSSDEQREASSTAPTSNDHVRVSARRFLVVTKSLLDDVVEASRVTCLIGIESFFSLPLTEMTASVVIEALSLSEARRATCGRAMHKACFFVQYYVCDCVGAAKDFNNGHVVDNR